MKKIIRSREIWDPGPRYAQGIISKPGRLLFIAGQAAIDSHGKIVGKGDIEAQTRAVLKNIEAILERAGGSRNSLVSTTSYVADAKYLAGFYKTRREFFAGALPTSTTIVVKGLAREEFLVEIEAIAALLGCSSKGLSKGKHKEKTMKPFLTVIVTVFLTGISILTRAESATPGNWEQTLGKAKQEGKVVLGSGVGIPAFRQSVIGTFAKRFGFDVEMRVLEGAELTTVVARECGAGRPSINVLLGGLSELISVYPKGCLAPAKAALILDEVTNPRNWKGGSLKWADPEGQYFLQTSDQVYGSLIINANLVKAKEITAMKDLLKPQYVGKIASYDPRKSGAGQSDATYWYATLGEDFVKRLFVDQKVVYTSDHRQLAEWIARGVYLVGLGSVDRNVEPLRQEGLPIGIIASLTDAPGYITGGSSVLKLVKDSPHPNAATVLLNWLASKEGQEIFSQATGHPSRRVDVGTKGVPSHRIPNTGTDYLDTYTYEFYSKKRPEISKKLTELLGR